MDQIKSQHQSELALIEEKANNTLDKKIAEKEKELSELNNKIANFANEKELLKKIPEKRCLIKSLKKKRELQN